MTIMVDELQSYGTTKKSGTYTFGKRESCHLTTDGDIEDLHEFASRLGLKRSWFQDHATLPHYDLTPNKRYQALRLGATEVPAVDQIKRIRAQRAAKQNEKLLHNEPDQA